MADHGTTTIWERWTAGRRSAGSSPPDELCRPLLAGSVGEWLYRFVLGIDQEPGTAGLGQLLLLAGARRFAGLGPAATGPSRGTSGLARNAPVTASPSARRSAQRHRRRPRAQRRRRRGARRRREPARSASQLPWRLRHPGGGLPRRPRQSRAHRPRDPGDDRFRPPPVSGSGDVQRDCCPRCAGGRRHLPHLAGSPGWVLSARPRGAGPGPAFPRKRPAQVRGTSPRKRQARGVPVLAAVPLRKHFSPPETATRIHGERRRRRPGPSAHAASSRRQRS